MRRRRREGAKTRSGEWTFIIMGSINVKSIKVKIKSVVCTQAYDSVFTWLFTNAALNFK